MLIFPMACLLLGGGAAVFAFSGLGGEWEGIAKAVFFLAYVAALGTLGFDLGRQAKTLPGHDRDGMAERFRAPDPENTKSLRR